MVDSSHVRALKGDPQHGLLAGRPGPGRLQAPSDHRRARHPLAVLLTGGNRNDVTQLMPLLDAIPPIRGGAATRDAGRTRCSPTAGFGSAQPALVIPDADGPFPPPRGAHRLPGARPYVSLTPITCGESGLKLTETTQLRSALCGNGGVVTTHYEAESTDERSRANCCRAQARGHWCSGVSPLSFT